MKKLFVSVPMKGRTEEAIRESIDKMHKAAEAITGEELEVIQSYVEHDPPETNHDAVYFLGRSIQRLANADYMVCLNNCYDWRGCSIERQAAELYGIPCIILPHEFIVSDGFEKKVLGESHSGSIPVLK